MGVEERVRENENTREKERLFESVGQEAAPTRAAVFPLDITMAQTSIVADVAWPFGCGQISRI